MIYRDESEATEGTGINKMTGHLLQRTQRFLEEHRDKK